MKLQRFDVIDFLDSDELLVEYLNATLAENDPKQFAKALGNVARAKGMSSIAEVGGLGRQSLYRALSDEGNPRVDTLFRVLEALNVRLGRYSEQWIVSFSSLSVECKRVPGEKWSSGRRQVQMARQ